MLNTKQYDLEERTFRFAQAVRAFLNKLPRSATITEDSKQLVRSSGSVGANYIEANEALSKKDFLMRVMICRKDAKETEYWLRLLVVSDINLSSEKEKLTNEATELRKIFGAIVEKSR